MSHFFERLQGLSKALGRLLRPTIPPTSGSPPICHLVIGCAALAGTCIALGPRAISAAKLSDEAVGASDTAGSSHGGHSKGNGTLKRLLVGFDFNPCVDATRTEPGVIRHLSLRLADRFAGSAPRYELDTPRGGLLDESDAPAGLELARNIDVAGGPVSLPHAADVLDFVGTGFIYGGLATSADVAGSLVDDGHLGLVNVAGSDVLATQIEVAHPDGTETKGLHLGVFDIDDPTDAAVEPGAMLPARSTELDVFRSGDGLVMAGLRHGSDRVYGIFSVGSYLGRDGPLAAFGLGLGYRIDATREWQVTADVTAYSIYPKQIFISNPGAVAKLRTALNWRVNPGFALYAGPTFTMQSLDPDGELGSIAPRGALKVDLDGRRRLLFWPGLGLGARLF